MRVITGAARGCKLLEPIGMDIRPTSGKLKETVFNIIQFDIEGRRVLDLFAGTGQLGIEALSRGAASTVFVDKSRDAVKLIRENLKRCKMTAEVIEGDSLAFISRGAKFDLIFLDPPYDTALLDKALGEIIRFDILSDGGIIICETMRDNAAPELPAPYYLGRVYNYGKKKLIVCGKQAK